MPQTQNPSTPHVDNGALRANTGPGVNQDPSALTTQQLLRENFWLRELLEAQYASIETRIDAGAKAVELLQAFADRTPTTMDVKHEVEALREVAMEKFTSINTTFSQNDKALTAALQAQEKQAIATNDSNTTANTKMEDSFTKQIDALGKARDADLKSVDDKINSIKERVTIIESRDGTVKEVHKDSRDNMSLIVAVIAVVLLAFGTMFVKH